MSIKIENYVSWVGEKSLRIVCTDPRIRKHLFEIGGKRSLFAQHKVVFLYHSEQELARLFIILRDLSFGFVGGSGWPPSAVFVDLREKGLLAGNFIEVVWRDRKTAIATEK